MTTTRVRTRASLSAVAVGLLIALGPATTSAADPADPSDQELQAARSAVLVGVSAVADIEVQLAQQSAARDAAEANAAIAGEDYVRAEQDRIDAASAATRAGVLLESANAQMETSRRTLVAIALAAARSSGAIDGVQAFLSADGFDEVVARSTALSRMGAKADRAVQEFRASTLVADTLAVRAEAAVTESAATATAAQDALATANQAQSDADAAVVAAEVQRDALIVQLAAARSTTAEIERARQDQIDADRAARASAAAQAARTATPPPSGSTRPTATPVAAPAAPGSSAPAPNAPPTTPPVTATPTTPPVTAPPTAPPVTAPPTPTPAPTTPAGSSRGSAGQGAAAVAWATGKLGLEYIWGATGPNAYDCSGLTSQAWSAAGVNITRTSRSQYDRVQKVSYNDLRPGDLIFWASDTSDASTIHHVALYAGGGQIIEASKPGVLSRQTAMRWASTMPYAGRP